MEEHYTCRHPDLSGCDNTCECWCDTCQTTYEDFWKKIIVKENLCDRCGVPKVMTLAKLLNAQYIHFFKPCESCRPAFKECMAAAKLCELCRGTLSGSICTKCESYSNSSQ